MTLLIVLWVLFFVSHSVLASNRVKAAAEVFLGAGFMFYRLVYNIISLAFLAGILYILFYAHDLNFVFPSNHYTHFASAILAATGVVIMFLAFRNYDIGEFTGFRQLAQKIHHPERLSYDGLNAYVRNPLYTGIILFVLGYFINQPTWMNLVTLIIIYLYIYIGTKLEEKKLEEVYGAEYRQYKKRVKMLIPFIF
jgi:protein-S-isoprenylcysteine O-methyltransferase Ste14